jgi:hypothetical protein
MTAQEVLERRFTLCTNGYTPLPLFGKEPPVYGKNNKHKSFDQWQLLDNVTRGQLEMWDRSWPDARNTGILTRLTPSLDADILNQDAAVAVEDLVRERFEERGYILVRIGLPPKRAILFRTLNPFDKIVVNFVSAPGKPEKIEFLCDGQQLVADGIHPDTGKPYSWFGGTPWQTAHDDLPYISEEEARQLVNDIVEMLCRDFGYQRKADRPKRHKGNNQFANEADWQYLYDNVLKGDELHDSLRNLAAKLIASGTSPGAAVNQLRALMETSTAPRDDRWNARFDDIPRLVDSAVEKYQNPQPQSSPSPASSLPPLLPPPPPPPPPPQSPGAQSAGPQPSGSSSSASPIEDTLKIFREWLLLDDDIPVLAMLGTVAANMLPGDAIWLGLIAPPQAPRPRC